MSPQRLPASPKRAPQEGKAGEASAPVTTWPQKHTSPLLLCSEAGPAGEESGGSLRARYDLASEAHVALPSIGSGSSPLEKGGVKLHFGGKNIKGFVDLF